jgi:hypothetical protein
MMKEKKMRRRRIRIFLPLVLLAMAALVVNGCILIEEPTAQPATATATPEDIIIPDTATPQTTAIIETATALPSDTPAADTPVPSATPLPSATATNTATATQTATLIRTPTPTPLPYSLQPGSPAYISNFAHPQAGCNWIGVAGQVFGPQGVPQTNLVVVVEGLYGGKVINAVGVTGTVAGDIYGPGGYEVAFSNTLLATQGMLSAQVFDLSGNPLTEAITFDTYSSCAKNLIIINFSQ